MPLAESSFPISTDWDPVEDSPGSVDPLGTLSGAENLADILLPGLTARMYRIRLLTTTAVTAAIADRVVRMTNGREEVRLPARLAFERLFVSALVRLSRDEGNRSITRRVPGRHRAAEAYDAHEPLTATNFLKGQATNGPFGVMATLATSLGIVDDRGWLGRSSSDLLIAWSGGEELRGILDPDADSSRLGAKWATDIARSVSALVNTNEWPRDGHRIWDRIASVTRPDGIKPAERRVIAKLLEDDPIRKRVFELLRGTSAVQAYRAALSREWARGEIERQVLVAGLSPTITHSPEDRIISKTMRAIEAYESVSIAFQQAFDSMRWALTRLGGMVRVDALLTDSETARAIGRGLSSLRKAKPRLDGAISELLHEPALSSADLIGPLEKMSSEASVALTSGTVLLSTVLERHERVQKAKRKAVWIDRGASWTLLDGGLAQEEPPHFGRSYLHPFRIQNAYSFMVDLGRVSVPASDETN